MYRSSVPLNWRLQQARYRLIGTRCKKCGDAFFPPRHICPKCRRKGEIEDIRFKGLGEIQTYTIIKAAAEGFEGMAPYTVAIVRLNEGPSVSGQVIGDPRKVKTGRKVRAVFRKLYETGPSDIINYGLKWELVE